jgi:hypothetical protein
MWQSTVTTARADTICILMNNDKCRCSGHDLQNVRGQVSDGMGTKYDCQAMLNMLKWHLDMYTGMLLKIYILKL